MTLAELLNGVVYTGTLAGACVAIGGLAFWVIVRPLRNFLRREIVTELVSIRGSVDSSTKATEALQTQLEQHIADGHLHTAVIPK